MANKVSITINSPEEARELFLLRYRDIKREDVNELMKEFRQYNIKKNPKCELEINEAMMLFEGRGEAKTASELRDLVYAQKDKNSRLNFLEWLCVVYDKTYADVNSFADDAAREIAAEAARKAGEEAARIEAELAAENARKEAEAKEKADRLEAESKLVANTWHNKFTFPY